MQRITTWTRCVVLCLLSTAAFAAQPVISGMTPRGVQRGATSKIVISGTRVKDARQLLMDIPGVNVKSVTPVDNAKVEVEFEVPADANPGFYPVRLVTESAISNMMLLAVGGMPTVAEVEPNSEFGTPQEIENNVTVEGTVAREDEDYYVVNLKKGERLTVEVEGTRIRNGRASPFFDPYVAILNSERFELAVNDDAPLLRQDCVCSAVAPEDGKYIVVVRDSSFGGANDRYRLHVGSYPRPVAVVPAGGAPGEIIEATFVGIGGDQWTEKIQLPSEPTEEFPVSVSNERGVAPSPNYLRVQPMGNTVEVEPNNSFKESTAGALPGAFCGILAEPGDVDYFSFEAKKGQIAHVKMFARKVLRSSLDSVVNMYNAGGGRVAGNDDSGGPDSFFEYTIPADGVYHLGVSDHLRGGGPGHAYRLEVKLSGPEITLSLPDRRRYEATNIAVPQGNHTAVMINASRRRCGGAIDLSGLNLPEGVTITPIQMPANRSTVPLLLSATPDAKLDGRLVEFVAKIPEQTIPSGFSQRHQLLIGQNNSVVNDYYANRAAVAVTKKCPCTIQIVQPQVPIVRDGAMDLTVKVDRGGYENDIAIRLLYNPPGIGASGSIRIPKGQNEAKIPLTANGSAAIGEWPIIVYASIADAVGGAYEIATKPATLTIEDRIFSFGFPKTSSELGADADVIVDVTLNREFEGTGELELVGFPAGITCEKTKVEVKNDTEQVSFPVKVSEKARVGQHKTLVVRAAITSDKGLIRQTQGTGTIQVDKPLPPPVEKPAPAKPAAKPAPKPAAKPPAPVKKKPLSRLEQLRLMREKARKGEQ